MTGRVDRTHAQSWPPRFFSPGLYRVLARNFGRRAALRALWRGGEITRAPERTGGDA